ncbi:MAG: phenylalanine--tRNA ligase subunit beta, partial [Dehalococcoidia bacterium]|nr:phenylalanine--tRNA ligase subunit beta [Dehalococcoidia bacterium]
KQRFVPISRYPGIERDIAVIVNSEISMEKVRSIILKAPLAREVRLFDVYSGPPLPAGKKSLAFSVLYQSNEKTLTDEEVNRGQEKVLRDLERQVGAALRS